MFVAQSVKFPKFLVPQPFVPVLLLNIRNITSELLVVIRYSKHAWDYYPSKRRYLHSVMSQFVAYHKLST
jgi:hypothetical protein